MVYTRNGRVHAGSKNADRIIRSMVSSKRTKPKTKKFRGSRAYGDYNRNKTTNTLIDRSPFPMRYKCKMFYEEKFTFTTGTAGVMGTEQVMRPNSLFDLNFTGVGHQPYGFDQMTPLYARYMVNYVQIELKFTDPSADGMQVTAFVQSNGNTLSLTGLTPETAAEIPFSKSRFVNNTGSQQQTIKWNLPAYRLLGVSKLEYKANPTIYGAAVSTNPTQVGYLRFSAASLRGNAGDTVECMCRLILWTTFYDRIYQAGS